MVLLWGSDSVQLNTEPGSVTQGFSNCGADPYLIKSQVVLHVKVKKTEEMVFITLYIKL